MAGITVRLAPDDPQSVVLRFFDKEGLDVDEATQRRIERLYHREDFRRVLAREIGDIGFPPRALEYYTAALIESVDLSKAREAGLKLVLDYSFGTTSFVMPNLLAKLEAEVLVVNPYANTASVLTFDRQASAARVSELVRASGAHLGAVLDPGRRAPGHRGRPRASAHRRRGPAGPLDAGDRGASRRPGGPAGGGQPGGRGDLPAGRGRDRVDEAVRLPPHGGGPVRADHHGGQPVRAGSSSPASCPPTTPRPPWSTWWPCSTATGRKLSELVAELPAVHIAHQAVHTPWDQKGMVMRTLVERSQGRDLVLVDGVKVLEADGWALVLPDPEEPLTHVWAEGPTATAESASSRAQEYARCASSKLGRAAAPGGTR